ncbi:hypothetical protein ACOSQ3_002310 [Xanthoceras sorbifolium]
MLAKDCWHPIHNKKSLAARVLKWNYYPRLTFINVVSSRSGSFLWKSLLLGRELPNLGLRWRAGPKSEVFVYKDKWLPRPSTFKVISHPVLGEKTLVRELQTELEVEGEGNRGGMWVC